MKKPDNVEFNYCLDKSRSRIGECIRILKSRWLSLENMTQQLRSQKDMVNFQQWIAACCMLHNMLIKCNDPWELEYVENEKNDVNNSNENVEEQDDQDPRDPLRAWKNEEMRAFREALKKTTLDTNYANRTLPRVC